MHEQERDVAKYWTDSKVDIALYGLENQTKVDRAMPLRIMGYDGAAYRKQVLKSEDVGKGLFGRDDPFTWNHERGTYEGERS